jgi:hypothetical protein
VRFMNTPIQLALLVALAAAIVAVCKASAEPRTSLLLKPTSFAALLSGGVLVRNFSALGGGLIVIGLALTIRLVWGNERAR